MKKYIIFLFAFLLFISCKRIHKQDVLMLYPNWAEGIAVTHLAKVILEEKGYNVTLKRLEPGPIYATLSRGDADVYMDAWLPYTQKDYWAKYGNKIEVLGTVFDDGFLGLVVPSYVSINSIEDLNSNKEKFNKKIYGIASGSGLHSATEQAIKEYHLDFNQITSSETAMITALKKAIDHEKWIVITGWKPHFIWGEYELKPLKDPKNVYKADSIKIISRKGFSTDKPEISSFFKKFKLNENMLNELMKDVAKDRNPDVGCKVFYLKYKNTLDKWLDKKTEK